MSPLLDLKLLLVLVAVNGAPILITRIFGTALGLPIDAGRRFLGQPLLGDHKTWRGLVAAMLTGTALAPMLGLSPITGLLIGLLSMLGDLASSFVKRRLHVSPGSRAPLLDQLPEVLLPLYALQPILGVAWTDIALITTGFVLVDLGLSRLLYRWHIRARPY